MKWSSKKLVSYFSLFIMGLTDLSVSLSCSLSTKRWWSGPTSLPVMTLTSSIFFLIFLDMHSCSTSVYSVVSLVGTQVDSCTPFVEERKHELVISTYISSNLSLLSLHYFLITNVTVCNLGTACLA